MFGKTAREYLDFQKWVLGILAAAGLARLWLSLEGLPDTAVRWLSMNVVGWAGVLYYGVAVHTRGFGSYQRLLPLAFFQTVVMQAIAVLGILIAIGGRPNIFASPEFSFGASSQWVHLLSHLTIGIILPPFLMWGASSLVLLVTRKLARRPAVA